MTLLFSQTKAGNILMSIANSRMKDPDADSLLDWREITLFSQQVHSQMLSSLQPQAIYFLYACPQHVLPFIFDC